MSIRDLQQFISTGDYRNKPSQLFYLEQRKEFRPKVMDTWVRTPVDDPNIMYDWRDPSDLQQRFHLAYDSYGSHYVNYYYEFDPPPTLYRSWAPHRVNGPALYSCGWGDEPYWAPPRKKKHRGMYGIEFYLFGKKMSCGAYYNRLRELKLAQPEVVPNEDEYGKCERLQFPNGPMIVYRKVRTNGDFQIFDDDYPSSIEWSVDHKKVTMEKFFFYHEQI